MLDEEIISLNRMKLFARSSDLSVVTAKDMNIVVNLVEKQQKEIEELKEKNKTLKNLQNDTNRLYIEMIERKNYFERELQKVVDKIKDSEIIYAIEVLQSLLDKEE